MAGSEKAVINRSLRTIRNELEFLADSDIITPQQLTSILSQLPENANSRAAAAPQNPPTNNTPPPVHSPNPPNPWSLSTLSEKLPHAHSPAPPPGPPPYTTSAPPPLAHATALYAYPGTDPGDCVLAPNDRIAVHEYTNAEWWKGRNERTGQEGIFPRNYVRVVDEGSGYGNLPLETAQAQDGHGQAQAQGPPSKMNEQGKKFGKKLGNAAVFGAGATIGSKIVDTIF